MDLNGLKLINAPKACFARPEDAKTLEDARAGSMMVNTTDWLPALGAKFSAAPGSFLLAAPKNASLLAFIPVRNLLLDANVFKLPERDTTEVAREM